MPKVWSINTTVRNPERLIEFLSVLEEFEGMPFDNETQALYQKALVKHKYYQPMHLPEDLRLAYEDDDLFSDEDTERVFSFIKSPDLRGRTSVSRCNQMGLAIARKKLGPVVITELGKNILNGKMALDEFFLRYFLKWQLNNPLESGYDDFNISPFISTLDIINQVNILERERGNKSKGISKNEFALFIIPLKDYSKITETVNNILKYRDDLKEAPDQSEFYSMSLDNCVFRIFNLEEGTKEFNKKRSNLEDYADSAMRWFRMTQLLYYRGGERYIDIAPSRTEEVKKLLEVIPRSSHNFETEEEYRNYLINPHMPDLPWDNVNSIKLIIKNLAERISYYQNEIDSKFPGKRLHDFEINPQIISNDINDLKSIENTFRINLNSIINEYNTLKESDLSNLEKYIEKLDDLANKSRPRHKSSRAPLCLEWYTSLSLMALDDAIEIRPNLLRGDDGLPTFTAGGGSPDIECYYDSFNMIVEVTLMKGRNQFMAEVQPILRHLKEFDLKNEFKESYLLFMAPSLYSDTKNHLTFFISQKYEGIDVNLVPLTINLYNKLLKIVLDKSKSGKYITHDKLKEFFDICVDITKTYETFEWELKIDSSLDKWAKSFN